MDIKLPLCRHQSPAVPLRLNKIGDRNAGALAINGVNNVLGLELAAFTTVGSVFQMAHATVTAITALLQVIMTTMTLPISSIFQSPTVRSSLCTDNVSTLAPLESGACGQLKQAADTASFAVMHLFARAPAMHVSPTVLILTWHVANPRTLCTPAHVPSVLVSIPIALRLLPLPFQPMILGCSNLPNELPPINEESPSQLWHFYDIPQSTASFELSVWKHLSQSANAGIELIDALKHVRLHARAVDSSHGDGQQC